jgi:ATP/maltotriose-dependent transcriptional regulator MalT
MIKTAVAKITRPKLSGISPRKRLFKLLDSGREKPVAWVSGPAGSGKTTLVASYLDERKLPCLWYQVDAGDADLATFFYYLGQATQKAAPRFRKPLPLLTPEYLPGLPVFTQRFFEQLYARLKPPFALVLDNYQEAPEKSPLHELVSLGLSLLPEGIQVFVLSRTGPLPAFMRLRANSGCRWSVGISGSLGGSKAGHPEKENNKLSRTPSKRFMRRRKGGPRAWCADGRRRRKTPAAYGRSSRADGRL